MDQLLENKDIELCKLKTAHFNHKFLEVIVANSSHLEKFNEVWNATCVQERVRFMGSVTKSISNKLCRDIEIVVDAFQGAATLPNPFQVLLQDDAVKRQAPAIHGLIRLLSISHPVLREIQSFAYLLVKLIHQVVTAPFDWTCLFTGEFVSKRVGGSLLMGEKYILSSRLYDSFEESITGILSNKRTGQSRGPPGVASLNQDLFIHILLLEDKILENYFQIARTNKLSVSREYEAPRDMLNFEAPADDHNIMLINPIKSKEQSIVKLRQENHRFFRVRTSIRPINTTSLIEDFFDLKILGSFYSLNESHKNGLSDSAHLLFHNFMAINHIMTGDSADTVISEFREKLNAKKQLGQNGYNQQKSSHSQASDHHRRYKQNQNGQSGAQHPHHNNQLANKQREAGLKKNFDKNQASKDGRLAEMRKYSGFSKGSDFSEVKRDRFVSNHEVYKAQVELFEAFEPFSSEIDFKPQKNKKPSSLLSAEGGDKISLQISSSKKITLKATSSSYYHPDDFDSLKVPTSAKKLAKDQIETNFSINSEELDLSKNLSGFTSRQKNQESNLFASENFEENRMNIERFDYSENASILNLIEPQAKQTEEEIGSKRSIDSLGLSRELLPNSPRTDDTSSNKRVKSRNMLNDLEPGIPFHEEVPVTRKKSDIHSRETLEPPLLQCSAGERKLSKPEFDAKNGLYTIKEVGDEKKKPRKSKQQTEEDAFLFDESNFPKIEDAIAPGNGLTAMELCKLHEHLTASKKPTVNPVTNNSHKKDKKRKPKPPSYISNKKISKN